jgi:hypothetical protein
MKDRQFGAVMKKAIVNIMCVIICRHVCSFLLHSHLVLSHWQTAFQFSSVI